MSVATSQSSSESTRRLAAVILAAGKGTRMNSDLPKVLHPVADRPMVMWVVEACEAVGCDPCVIVVGHGGELVQDALRMHENCVFVEQAPQLGTGHAVRQAEPVFREKFRDRDDLDVLVLCGDGPLIRTETLRTLLERHRGSGAAATLATAELSDPSGYGRIVRDVGGRFQGIVEEKDATEAQRSIREVNPSYYCFRASALFELLAQVRNDNAKGEYYLTDVFTLMLDRSDRVEVVKAAAAEDVLSINTTAQLAEVDAILRGRLAGQIGPESERPR